jgi:outer membrane protein OmpA-like peptidoglycan-associated protein
MCRSMIFSFLVFIGSYTSQAAATTAKVSGLVINVISGAKIPGVSFYTLLNNRRQLLCEADTNGKFTFDLSSAGPSILVEKNGFRSASAPLTIHRQEGKNTVFFIRFPLIPLDKQTQESPYMQSEQKDYTLANSGSSGKTVRKTIRIFDALTGKSIDRASILLTYTKGEKKESREITPDRPDAKLVFSQADIIGFSVKSKGYQTYTGNLILEKIDGSDNQYDILLSPQVNLLSLYLSGSGGRLRMTSENGNEVLLEKADNNAYCALISEGNYGLRIFRTNGNLLHSEKIALTSGLNFLTIDKFEKKDLTQIQPERKIASAIKFALDTADFAPYELTTVYFNQSEYLLKQEEKDKLDELAMRLRSASRQKIRLVGHTDNVGDPKKNLTLSEYRTRVIRSYLLDKQVPEWQILFTWVGGKFPVKKNDSEENKKMNRRVEITVLPNI